MRGGIIGSALLLLRASCRETNGQVLRRSDKGPSLHGTCLRAVGSEASGFRELSISVLLQKSEAAIM